MFQGGSGLGFLDEAALPLGVGDELRGQDLEGDLAVQIDIHRAVDDPHASTADLREDLVVGTRPERMHR
jgi:hypothetical protein